MIKVEQLSKHYGEVRAVDNLSFEVAEQETLVLLGTSGCGKTTTLKMLNRLIEPTSGTISIAGQNVADKPVEELRRGIGYVLQNTGLFPHYTIAENIAVVPRLLGWDKKRIRDRTAELVKKLHLSDQQLSQYPGQLSGGQQQRVGLARALVADPPVLLMDEPFGALDNVTRSKIHEEFKALDELKRKTIIMVTHDVQEAFELADRICLMDKGRIIQMGKPAELLFNPVNDFVSGFLKEQRLLLEFKSVKLIDLWNQLPSVKSPDGKLIGIETDVWTALEKLRGDDTGHLYIKHNNEIRAFNFAELTSAFHHYQNRAKA